MMEQTEQTRQLTIAWGGGLSVGQVIIVADINAAVVKRQ